MNYYYSTTLILRGKTFVVRPSWSLVTISEQDACPYGHAALPHYENFIHQN
ncbi:hypothetical protein [Rivularia sp. UHCC 0363]|uniref:hypothetical protein n=1 Tax=Rivularia sp. UHCC 0363 TaxID=3110244 RepID=UPI002B219A73|nr:hypothetical protein [Rivularia sp. UHCC 0363]MEA5598832.1 hypothetical protein [Rivularia sp. UHCC 0363]